MQDNRAPRALTALARERMRQTIKHSITPAQTHKNSPERTNLNDFMTSPEATHAPAAPTARRDEATVPTQTEGESAAQSAVQMAVCTSENSAYCLYCDREANHARTVNVERDSLREAFRQAPPNFVQAARAAQADSQRRHCCVAWRARRAGCVRVVVALRGMGVHAVRWFFRSAGVGAVGARRARARLK